MRSQAFDDFDAFAQQVRDADFRMLLLNPARHIWAISQVNLGGIDIQYGHEGGGNITEGRSRSDGYLFFVPVTNANAHAANGSVLDSGSVVVLEPGIEFCLRSEVEHEWCSVFVPTSRLTRDGRPAEPRSESKKMACRVTRPTLPIANQLRALVQQVMAAEAQCAGFDSTPAALCAAEKLVQLVSLLLEQRAVEHNLQGRPAVPRQEIIRASLELVEQRGSEPVRVGELATAADVSERTLRAALLEYFGLGPVRYLQLRHIHRIHRALKASDPGESTVSQVLIEHGEYEFSRFASRYRRLFGQFPSETLVCDRQANDRD